VEAGRIDAWSLVGRESNRIACY